MLALFFDDDVVRHERFVPLLCDLGFTVLRASTGEAAVTLLDANVFDVAFLDHDMDLAGGAWSRSGYGAQPMLDGTDVARHIASMPTEKRPKRVVIHSWNTYAADRMRDIIAASGVDVTCEVFPPRIKMEGCHGR